jgi:hypothetical protein
MAQVEWSVEFNPGVFEGIRQMGRIFQEVNARALGFIGLEGARLLRTYLRPGGDFNLRAWPKDDAGRRTISYSIGRRAKHVRISSYPMNLFERGRTLRSGAQERGRRIVTGPFKAAMEAQLPSLINQFDNRFFQEMVDQAIEKRKNFGRAIGWK